MATLAATPRYRATRSLDEHDPEVPTALRGREGEILINKSRDFLRRWIGYRQRGLIVLNNEEVDYQAVPPRRSYTSRVRYNFRGRGKPLPYPLDDEE